MPTSRRVFLRNSAAFLGTSLAGPAARFERIFRTFEPSAQFVNRTRLPVPPAFVVGDFSKKFEPAYLANGLIGIRPGPNPLTKTKTQVSGFVFTHVPYEMQSLSAAPYPLETDIRVGTSGTVGLLEYPDLVKTTRQALDMSNGELTTQMTFAPGNGATLNIEVLQFTPRTVPSLVCQEIRVVASADTEVTFVPSIDAEGTLARTYTREPPARTNIDLVGGFESAGNRSKLGIAVFVA